MQIIEVDEPAFVHAGARSRFHDVSTCTYASVSGERQSGLSHYNEGKFLNAAATRPASKRQMSVGIESGHGRVLVRQIAGLTPGAL